MYAFERGIVVLLILALKVCNTNAKNIPGAAHSQARATKSPNNSSLTSYYRYDPYGPNTYAFGFEVNDNRTGNVQFRDERRYLNGSVEGSYGYVRPDGRVTVTHFVSDNERGYLSKTETFEAGAEHKWQQHWPTKKPHILMERPEETDRKVIYDKERHLNLTEGKIPAATAEAVRQQHGLDVNKIDLQTDLIDPVVLDIVNGKIPLQQQQPGRKQNGSAWGYETVHNFIPSDFPIVPFQLPEKFEEKLEKEQQNVEERHVEMSEMEKAKASKYDKAKENNAEKSISVGSARDGGAAVVANAASGKYATNLPAPLAGTTNDGNSAWFEQIIDDTRREFLRNIPNLS